MSFYVKLRFAKASLTFQQKKKKWDRYIDDKDVSVHMCVNLLWLLMPHSVDVHLVLTCWALSAAQVLQ